MDLRAYASILRRRWLSLVVVSLALLAAVALVTLMITPRYTATTRLFFGVQSGESVTDLSQGSTFTEKQMSSYAQVAISPLVLEPVIDTLKLQVTAEELANTVSATVPPGTVILQISARSTDAHRAADVSNAIGRELASVVGSLSPPMPDGTESVRATTLAAAITPITPSSPNIARNLIIGLLAGALFGVLAAFVLNAADTKLRTEEQLRDLLELPVLGVVPFDAQTGSEPVAITAHPHSARAESIRRLRTNLEFVSASTASRSLLITSSISGEGKSVTAINLATALAEAGKRVLLIDADLRRPSIATYLGLEGNVGLTTVLIGRAAPVDVVQQWQDTSLDILPSGRIPPNPSELLGSSSMRDLLRAFEADYDAVIIDSSPMLPVTDAAVLSRIVSGTVVVVGADRIHRAQLVKAAGSLHAVGATVVGAVLNKIARRDAVGYGYGYGYTTYESVDADDPSSVAALPTAGDTGTEVQAGSPRLGESGASNSLTGSPLGPQHRLTDPRPLARAARPEHPE